MTARSSMAGLITKVRSLVGDTSGTATQHYSDDNVQTALDIYQELVMMEALECIPTPTSSGYDYKNFKSRKYYEGGTATGGTVTILQNSTYGTVTPDTSDLINGRYSFTASQATADLYITG